MSFAPKSPAKECPACHMAVPLAALRVCPACGAKLDAPGDLGERLVEAMTDVLSDPLGRPGVTGSRPRRH